MYCPSCGNKIPKANKKCSHCGIDISKVKNIISVADINTDMKNKGLQTKFLNANGRTSYRILFILAIFACLSGVFVWKILFQFSSETENQIRSSPKVLWTTKYNGQLPVTIGDNIYFIDTMGFPVAVEISSGKQVWSSEYDAKFISTTEEALLIVRPNNRLYSLDAKNGILNWKYFSKPNEVINQIVTGDGIIVLHIENNFDTIVTAINALNGVPLWSILGKTIHNKIDKIIGGKVYIYGCPNCLQSNYAIEIETGKVINYPMLVNGVVNMQENNIYIVQGEHDYTNYLLAFDATQNVELWRKVSCNSHWDIKIYEDIVLNATSDKQYCFPYPHDISRINAGYALDLNTGEEKWSWNSVLGSPIAGNSTTIYFINSLDIIHAVNPATGKIKWSNDEIIIDSIVHENDNFVYAFEQSTKISDSSHSLYAINAKNGSIKWEFEANNEINSGMVIGDKIMFWTNSVIYFVDMETGEQIWSETPLNSSIANVIFRNNILLVTTHDGHLIAFR